MSREQAGQRGFMVRSEGTNQGPRPPVTNPVAAGWDGDVLAGAGVDGR